MNYLVDTNTVSEWVKPRPDEGVIRWFAEIDEDQVFLSVVTIAELRHGAELLSDGARRSRLEAWLEWELPGRFEGRIISIGPDIAERWGVLTAMGKKIGRTIPVMDAFLAATAEIHGLELVTRNTADFERLGLPLINPWTS